MKVLCNLRARLVLAAALLLLTLGSWTAAFGQLTPSDDAYVNSALPTTNYGAATTLNLQSAVADAFIRFDLTTVPSGYTGSSIAKATLKLYVNSVTTAGSFNVDYVNGTWAEQTIKYSLQPAIGTTIAGSVPLTTASKGKYVEIDVTAAVLEWLNNTQPNDGIALVANSPLVATFDSKENTSASHPPEIDIVYAGIAGVTTANGSGLTGGGTGGTLNLALTNSCAPKQVLQWNGSSWACAAVGTGTITGVTAGSGLTGGGNSGTVALKLDVTKVVTGVTAGTGLTGGGTGGALTLNLDTTKVPQIGGNNTFAGTNTFTGNTTNGTPSTAVIQSGMGIGLEIQSLSTAVGVDPALTVYEGGNNGEALFANAPSANAVGVYSTAGAAGVWGSSAKTGVEGQTTTGTAGVFLATSGGKLLSGQNNSGEVFSVGSTGTVTGTSASFPLVYAGAVQTSQSIIGNMTSNAPLTPAILGDALASGNGSTIGVEGLSSTTSGYGVYGDGGSSGTGVYGHSSGGIGVTGNSSSGHGVQGQSAGGNTAGVSGVNSVGGYGVKGLATGSSGQGVWGESFGASWSNGAGPDGVHGISHNKQGVGVSGTNTDQNGIGVWGSDPNGYGFVTDSHVQQGRSMGGWVKAMAYIDSYGNVVRCFNSQLAGSAASTAPCGITVTTPSGPIDMVVDFGFQIDDRFVPVTFTNPLGNNTQDYFFDASYLGMTNSQVCVGDNNNLRSPFFVLVF